MSSNPPLHARLYDVMAERIHTGEWAEGERVPTEKVLVEEFGTSRGPIRQALAQLRTDGLIDGGRGAPARVQRAVPSQSFDTYLSFTDWAHAIGAAPGQKTIEIARRLADDALARSLDIERDRPVIVVTRLRTLDDEPVMLERGTYVESAGRHLLDVDLDVVSIYQILRDNDIVPTRAHNVIDAVGASDLDARWLAVDAGAPLLRVRRVSRDQHGAVIDIAENRYLPARATFTIENAKTGGARLAVSPSD